MQQSIAVVEIAHDHATRIPLHVHERARVAFCRYGAIEERERDRVLQFRRGDVIFWAPGATHEDLIGAAGARSVRLELPDATFAQIGAYFPTRSSDAVRGELLEGATARMLEAIEAGAELQLEGALYEVIARAWRVRGGGEAPALDLARARSYVAAHYRETVRLADVASAAEAPLRGLSQRFRDAFGVTPLELVRTLRIEESAARLAGSDAPIDEIALRCGFWDRAHLTRELRNATGLTPARFRDAARGASRG